MNQTFWNERYAVDAYVYGTEPNDFLAANAHRIPPGKVLCLAEGEGRNAVFLASRGFHVTAVDFSAEGVAKTRRLAASRNVSIQVVQADLADWRPAPSSFIGVVAIFAHLPAPIRARVHGWLGDALQPGGVFVLEAYRPAQLTFDSGGPKDVSMLMTPETLRAELTSLTIDSLEEVERSIHEGIFHGGPSATVQVLAHRAP